ncbi:MAG: hypothetical protein LBM65_06775 [Oscillospiraceae bacterium]|jgi:hypothetical protein|nr:hypothetical protein [Oscillospiraceae bacterium]
MAKKALFGKNIPVACEYCENSEKIDQNLLVCLAKRSIKNGKCRKFEYDPLRRVPKTQNQTQPAFEPKDFLI